MQSCLNQAEPLESFLFNHLKREWDTSTLSGQSGFVKEAHALIEKMHNNFTKQILLKKLEDIAKLSLTPKTTNKPKAHKTSLDDQIVAMLVMNPELYTVYNDHPIKQLDKSDSALDKVAQLMAEKKELSPPQWIEVLRSHNVDCQVGPSMIEPSTEVFQDMLNRLSIQLIEHHVGQLLESQTNGSIDLKAQQHIQALMKLKLTLSGSTQ